MRIKATLSEVIISVLKLYWELKLIVTVMEILPLEWELR